MSIKRWKGIPANDWAPFMAQECEQEYFIRLGQFLNEEYETQTVYPQQHDIFHALRMSSYGETKVVLLGQDPYHGPGQAHGLSFSVQPDAAIPPSLRNIFKELHADIGCPPPAHGHLLKWAEQGVLLLNTVLSVREGSPYSHKGQGWETFTDRIIERLNSRTLPLVFILWGNHAQTKLRLIDADRHGLILSPHPSPLSASRGFFGSKPFSRANEFLHSIGSREIDWSL